MAIALLQNQAADGSGSAVGLDAKIDGDKIGISVFGDLGGGTVTIEFSPDATNWVTIDSFTAAGYKTLEIVPERGTQIRASIAGATNPDATVLMTGAFTGASRTDN
jgi:hypothetical protein